MDKFTFVGNGDINAVESLYDQFLADPSQVDETWQQFFAGFDFAKANFDLEGDVPENVLKEFKVIELIEAYRKCGHLFTHTNQCAKGGSMFQPWTLLILDWTNLI
jgi:2-oxoglutarate dehydrogenase E1 component